ncbi:hypothetical protein B0A54_04453 [Friedmanniomyces endolithicus]|uniref:Uncharacterized protein n=1 Tax=Friedmanniomyces endolithicus TaxID=329885 RepID=A0A4U0V962_9PEZI|nr:hypothetical protein LTS09_010747 [Friedmanniomyces endolithicus]TKA45357.1 hypothetical protein B0A54_04453 [Friedmanniomyces endolithicus]
MSNVPTRRPIAHGELCGHEWFRTGCLSCRAVSLRVEIEEATAESNQHGAAVDSYVVDLRYAGFSASGQKCLKAIAESEADIKKICDNAGQDSLQAAFELDAAEREAEGWQMLQRLTDVEGTDVRLYFDVEDTTKERQPFQRLDRTNIPATPDSLIREGLGFQMFLNYAKRSTRLPKDALGQEPGGAVMSLGRAIRMFPPEESTALSIAKSEANIERDLASDMANVSITAPEDAPSEAPPG